MTSELTGTQRRTYDAIIRHPTACALPWPQVRSLLVALAEVSETPNGDLRITYRDETLVLQRPLQKDMTALEELLRIRQLLERWAAPAEPGAPVDARPAASPPERREGPR